MISTQTIQNSLSNFFGAFVRTPTAIERQAVTPAPSTQHQAAPISLRHVATPTETVVMTVHSKVDSRCYQLLLAKCEELRRSGTEHLVVDLTEMPALGLSHLYVLHCTAKIFRDEIYATPEQGIRGLRRIAEENAQAGIHPQVKLLAANEEAFDMLNRAGMAGIFPIHRTESGALRAF